MSEKMPTYSEFWTEDLEVFTLEAAAEDGDGDDFFDDATSKVKRQIFTTISLVEDTAMAIFVFSLGTLLNSIILRCYWKNKDASSTYFRAFAVIDLGCLAYALIRRSITFVVGKNEIVFVSTKSFTNVVAALYNFCPLFLAWLWRSLTTSGKKKESCEWRKDAWFLLWR